MKSQISMLLLFCLLASSAMVQAQGEHVALSNHAGTDALITLDIRETDIKAALNLLAEQFDLNMVIDDDVTGLISVRLREVSLHGALSAILVSRGYDYETVDNIIRIAPTEVLAGERLIRQEREGIEPLISEVITLGYLDANDVIVAIEGLISERGRLNVLERRSFSGFQFGAQTVQVGSSRGNSGGDGLIRSRQRVTSKRSRSRTLLVTDTRANVERIKAVIRSIDVAPKQILIYARILEVETDTLEDLGIEFDLQLTPPTDGDNFSEVNLDFNQGTSSVGFPTTSNQGLNLQYRKLFGENAQVVLHTLLQDERTRTLSSPRILVLDGQEAAILVGEQFPIFETTISDQGTATESLSFFQPIGISLQVIAQITAENQIHMIIHPTVSSVGNFVTGSTGLSQPRINIREADTQVLVKNGETIIIGGLLEDVVIEREFKIPLLGDIPYLGALFTRTQTDIDQRNLIVFITPQIIEPDSGLTNEAERAAFLGIQDEDRYGTLSERRDKVDQHLRKAIASYKEAQYETAKTQFAHVLRLDGGNRVAAKYLGKIKEAQQRQ